MTGTTLIRPHYLFQSFCFIQLRCALSDAFTHLIFSAFTLIYSTQLYSTHLLISFTLIRPAFNFFYLLYPTGTGRNDKYLPISCPSSTRWPSRLCQAPNPPWNSGFLIRVLFGNYFFIATSLFQSTVSFIDSTFLSSWHHQPRTPLSLLLIKLHGVSSSHSSIGRIFTTFITGSITLWLVHLD
jgi:hypothetical protein